MYAFVLSVDFVIFLERRFAGVYVAMLNGAEASYGPQFFRGVSTMRRSSNY